MSDNKKRSVLSYVLPTFSEFEFVFFSSLITCSLVLFLFKQAGQIHSFLLQTPFTTSIPLALGLILVISIFVGSLIQMSVAAIRQPLASWDTEHRTRYIMLPTYILMFLGITQLLMTGFSKSPNFSVVTPIMVVLLIRYASIAVLGSLVRYSDWLNDKISILFQNYQVNKAEAMAAVLLGAVGAIIVWTSALPSLFIVVDSVGRLLIQAYRDLKKPPSGVGASAAAGH